MEQRVRPIIVVGASRSGTSLTAGILHRHGVWVGQCQDGRPINPKGFYENLKFKQYLKQNHLPISYNVVPEPLPGFKEFVYGLLEEEGYHGDFSSLQNAIEGAGLAYDQSIVDDFYVRDYWHDSNNRA